MLVLDIFALTRHHAHIIVQQGWLATQESHDTGSLKSGDMSICRRACCFVP